MAKSVGGLLIFKAICLLNSLQLGNQGFSDRSEFPNGLGFFKTFYNYP